MQHNKHHCKYLTSHYRHHHHHHHQHHHHYHHHHHYEHYRRPDNRCNRPLYRRLEGVTHPLCNYLKIRAELLRASVNRSRFHYAISLYGAPRGSIMRCNAEPHNAASSPP
ncbi:hypothetical protein E2C01_048111 [Portunus trituberculatus]|uniref:Uncharacterized protein n=1 Tax=Portunus trituberculatus TaxID=210409 RepID=A0A5B7GAA4_PORTR|nr:hypothetical protein [Portunus trituberculatus]